MKKTWVSIILLVFLAAGTAVGTQSRNWSMAGARDVENILPEKDRAAVVNGRLAWRLDNIVPELMKREGIDLWLVINREYNEDPVYMSMVSEPAMNARRLSILLFHDRGEAGFKKLTANWHGTGSSGPLYEPIFKDRSKGWKGQFETVAAYIREHKPRAIGLNFSEHWAFGDGLSVGLMRELEKALDPADRKKIVSAENLCIGWLETRSPAELSLYRHLNGIAHDIIVEFFSNRVIVPDVTTTENVVWWIRQKFTDLGLGTWFQPSISIQRSPEDQVRYGRGDRVIRRGDILHCDIGISYLGLSTDTQHNAYVLRLGEEDAPAGIKEVLRRGNRLQEIFMDEFRAGKTGNEIYLAALKKARAEGIEGRIYTHPLGIHGHAAGPTMGLTEAQEGVPVQGDYPLYENTCYAIELNVSHTVPEWGGAKVTLGLEDGGSFTKDGCLWLDGYPRFFHLIR
ncbi:MAG: aminopeptidase P family protein [Candidatus Aminicenantes bacterium]|nr:aminopeptidase P family protein [Candidatus Aminicenantes bacterium]